MVVCGPVEVDGPVVVGPPIVVVGPPIVVVGPPIVVVGGPDDDVVVGGHTPITKSMKAWFASKALKVTGGGGPGGEISTRKLQMPDAFSPLNAAELDANVPMKPGPTGKDCKNSSANGLSGLLKNHVKSTLEMLEEVEYGMETGSTADKAPVCRQQTELKKPRSY